MKDHLIANSHRSIRIANQQELQQRHQRKQQKINQARRNSNGESGCEEHSNSKVNNSPSPRTKHNRKQAQGNIYMHSPDFKFDLHFQFAFGQISTDHFTVFFVTEIFPKSAYSLGRTKSIPSTTSETCPTSSGSHQSTLSSASFLLPRMQAEQGSIGELQKYHGRYLKNRRHTLANVR